MLSHMNHHLFEPEKAYYTLCMGKIQPTTCFCSLWVKNGFYIFKGLLKKYTHRETVLDQKA